MKGISEAVGSLFCPACFTASIHAAIQGVGAVVMRRRPISALKGGFLRRAFSAINGARRRPFSQNLPELKTNLDGITSTRLAIIRGDIEVLEKSL